MPENPLDSKEIKPVYPKGNQSWCWVFTGRTDPKAETPILWPPDAKSRLIGKYTDAGKDWRLEEKGMTEDDMVGWHHRLNGHESEQTPGDSDGQGGLRCCRPWGRKELDTTERLNNNHWLFGQMPWRKKYTMPDIYILWGSSRFQCVIIRSALQDFLTKWKE